MILAEVDVFHSRPIAPTRRVALGRHNLPVDPAPGFGGILLGGIVAAHIGGLDPELFDDLNRLTLQLEHGRRIPQPRLRHRFQTDRIGLLRTTHRLVGDGEELRFEMGDRGAPAQHILAAVYAAGALPPLVRPRVLEVVRTAMRWVGPIDHQLVARLAGLDRGRSWTASALHDPVRWALTVLDLHALPGRDGVLRRFRELVWTAHPDHGGDEGEAAARIAELTDARRILLGG